MWTQNQENFNTKSVKGLWLVKKMDHTVNFDKIIVMLITKQSQNVIMIPTFNIHLNI